MDGAIQRALLACDSLPESTACKCTHVALQVFCGLSGCNVVDCGDFVGLCAACPIMRDQVIVVSLTSCENGLYGDGHRFCIVECGGRARLLQANSDDHTSFKGRCFSFFPCSSFGASFGASSQSDLSPQIMFKRRRTHTQQPAAPRTDTRRSGRASWLGNGVGPQRRDARGSLVPNARPGRQRRNSGALLGGKVPGHLHVPAPLLQLPNHDLLCRLQDGPPARGRCGPHDPREEPAISPTTPCTARHPRTCRLCKGPRPPS